ncbi:Uncharacterised protein [Gallibacterium anatis]|uniref:Uncharacterized protein n=1 Tax=Gallibacterium anatis TaxID=750 RepID=A0A377H882_9PAST|nr:hypothetical protein [Gallibacterium anatis]KGQ56046.1 hypothetical protein IE01_07260 [Gallibacterium anatis DSM 16844 = F 149]STO38775.1 Uncharacterised protein [Gallibacterium anatis]
MNTAKELLKAFNKLPIKEQVNFVRMMTKNEEENAQHFNVAKTGAQKLSDEQRNNKKINFAV